MDLGVDFHTHLIPEVDDGSRGAVETIAMAKGLVELGVRRIHLTPHLFRDDNEFTPAELARRTEGVNDLLAYSGIDVEVVAGAEYFYGERLFRALQAGEELIRFEHEGLGLVLIELPHGRPAAGVRRLAQALERRGISPVMAHPERYAADGAGLDRLLAWRGAGWLFQLNLRSLVGDYGARARAMATQLLAQQQYDFAGSDLHRPWELDCLRQAYRAVRDLASKEALP